MEKNQSNKSYTSEKIIPRFYSPIE